MTMGDVFIQSSCFPLRHYLVKGLPEKNEGISSIHQCLKTESVSAQHLSTQNISTWLRAGEETTPARLPAGCFLPPGAGVRSGQCDRGSHSLVLQWERSFRAAGEPPLLSFSHFSGGSCKSLSCSVPSSSTGGRSGGVSAGRPPLLHPGKYQTADWWRRRSCLG